MLNLSVLNVSGVGHCPRHKIRSINLLKSVASSSSFASIQVSYEGSRSNVDLIESENLSSSFFLSEFTSDVVYVVRAFLYPSKLLKPYCINDTLGTKPFFLMKEILMPLLISKSFRTISIDSGGMCKFSRYLFHSSLHCFIVGSFLLYSASS